MIRALACSALLAAPLAAQGSVFEDRNANGVRDAGEPGMAGVVVSDQEHVALTDSSGTYQLAPGGSGVVFVSLPRGFRATGPWWQPLIRGKRADFALAPAPEPRTLTFVHASDTHIQPSSAGRTVRLRALVDSIAPRFTIITGDLVRDALRVGEAEATGYYELFAREAAAFTAPVWTVPGNHEIFGVERTQSGVDPSHPLYGRAMYRRYRGPDYYSFNAGGVHFVALNTIDVDDQWYHGDVDSLQLAWLARDLAMIPATMPVVTFNHIPFYSVSEQLHGYTDGPPAPTLITVKGRTQFRHTVANAGDVIRSIGAGRYEIALAGHVHIGERIAFELGGRPLRFHQGAAIVSDTPSGPFVFPSGVTVYRVTDGRVDDGTFVPLMPRTP
ncbi:MAG: metallophosphoesterase [Gemmatimonadetes bacterium]|nr:metallophosphoesterase [Gemmatimonadota bacterium]